MNITIARFWEKAVICGIRVIAEPCFSDAENISSEMIYNHSNELFNCYKLNDDIYIT